DLGVPVAGADDGGLLHLQRRADQVGALRDPDRHAGRVGGGYRGVEGAGGVGGAGGVRTLAHHGDRAGGLRGGGRDVEEVGDVQGVGQGGVPGVDLEGDRGPGVERRGQRHPGVVVQLVGLAAGDVGGDVAAGGGELERAGLAAVHVDRECAGGTLR